MSDRQNDPRMRRLGRRAFLKDGTLFLAGSALASCPSPGPVTAAEQNQTPALRVGLVTDLHYADKDPRGSRHYRETPAKLAEAAKRFQEDRPDVLVELGDLIDSGATLDAEKEHLRRIAKQFADIPGGHHYVLGNHCVTKLTKAEFLEIVGQEKSCYSFDVRGYHGIVLDACFRSDGVPYGGVAFDWRDANIPPAQVEWLREDLRKTTRKALVFIHQRLDVGPPYGVANAPQVRKVLEDSGNVLAVLQGHHHRGDYQEVGNLHYCTLSAMVEGAGPANNAYAVMDILPGDAVRIAGFRKQKSYRYQTSADFGGKR